MLAYWRGRWAVSQNDPKRPTSTGLEPLTSVIPVHRSTNRANKPPTNHLLSERQGKMIKCKERHRSHTGVEATFEVATICVDPLCIVIHRPQY